MMHLRNILCFPKYASSNASIPSDLYGVADNPIKYLG